MVVREDQERVKTLISDTITLLCRNGLTFKSKFCINALIGITLDEDDVFLVDIRETVNSLALGIDTENDRNVLHNPDCTSLIAANSPSRKHKKSRKRAYTSDSTEFQPIESTSELGSVQGDINETDTSNRSEENHESATKTIKKEERDTTDDLVFVKDEPSENQMPMLNTSMLYHHHQQPPLPPPPPPHQHHHSDILDSLAQHGSLYGTPTSECLTNPTPWDASSAQSAAVDSSAQLFKCNMCNKTFQRRLSLIAHENAHKGIFSCTCPQCGHGFPNTNRLRSHMAQVHAATELRIPCPKCTKTFARQDHMKTHCSSVHATDDQKIPCPVCDRRFTRIDHMRRHLNGHYALQKMACSYCSRTFTRSDHLRSHTKAVHGITLASKRKRIKKKDTVPPPLPTSQQEDLAKVVRPTTSPLPSAPVSFAMPDTPAILTSPPLSVYSTLASGYPPGLPWHP